MSISPASSPTCTECHGTIPPESPGGICPRCLLAMASASGPAAQLPDDAGQPRRFLGDYELRREIGRGGMGVVYEAWQISLFRTVALKMVLAGIAASRASRSRFHVEIEAAARLDHPNILPVYGTGEYDGQLFFTTRLVTGGHFGDYLRRPETSVRQAVALLEQICRAVAHAHAHGVLHRDLKPSNILLGADGQPFLSDFGLARFLDAEMDLTHSTDAIGSPNYMAPEQVHGAQVTVAADIYSLGAVLYQILTRLPPFHAPNALATMRLVVEAEPKRPAELAPGVDRDLEAVTLRCLEKEPTRRYGSAQSLADDLKNWLEGKPVSARKLSPARRVWRSCRRHPVLASTLAVSCMAITSFAILSSIAAIRIGEANRRTEDLLKEARMENAETQFQQNRASEGLAALARLCRDHPDDKVVHQRLASALAHRKFPAALPSGASFDAKVLTAVWLADESLCMALTANGKLWRWQPAMPAQVSFDLKEQITAGAISPDGLQVAVALVNGEVRVLDSTGRQVGKSMLHKSQVIHMLWDHGGARLATLAGYRPRIWNLSTGSELPELNSSPAIAMQLSRDGRKLATALSGLSKPIGLRIHDTSSGALLAELFYPKEALTALDFSPGGDRIAGTTPTGSVVIWKLGNPASGPLVLRHGGARLNGVQFHPDGKRLASFAADGTLRLWHSETGEPGPSITQTDYIADVDFLQDGSRLVTACHDCTAQLWDPDTGQALSEPFLHPAGVFRTFFDPRGEQVIALSYDSSVRVWKVEEEPLPVRKGFLGAMAKGACWSPDGRTALAVTNPDNSTIVYRWDESAPPVEIVRWNERLAHLTASRDRRHVAVVAGNRVHCLDFRKWQWLTSPAAFSQNGTVAAFDPSGSWLLAGAADGSLRLMDIAQQRWLDRQWPHDAPILAGVFLDAGSKFVTATGTGTVTTWAREGGQLLRREQSDGGVFQQMISQVRLPRVLSVRGFVATFCDFQKDQCIANLNHRGQVSHVEFSPDERWLLTCSIDRTAQVWRLDESGPVLHRTLPHTAPVRHGNFSPDSLWVATAARDGTARVWDIASGAPLTDALPHGGPVNSVRFGADPHTILTASDDGYIRIWSLPTLTSAAQPLLPDIAEILAGRINDSDGRLLTLTSDDLEHRRRILQTAHVPDAASSYLRRYLGGEPFRRKDGNAAGE